LVSSTLTPAAPRRRRFARLQARFLEENPLVPFSVLDARAPLAAAASAGAASGADVERAR